VGRPSSFSSPGVHRGFCDPGAARRSNPERRATPTAALRRSGAFVNRDLAQYQVPVHADIPEIDAVMLDDFDTKANAFGVKGVGELGICGAGAAVANAVFNASGVRVRDFPITLEKVLPGLPLLDV
jgi:CO/xanthine dehydrogenase Mo-binding subunit